MKSIKEKQQDFVRDRKESEDGEGLSLQDLAAIEGYNTCMEDLAEIMAVVEKELHTLIDKEANKKDFEPSDLVNFMVDFHKILYKYLQVD